MCVVRVDVFGDIQCFKGTFKTPKFKEKRTSINNENQRKDKIVLEQYIQKNRTDEDKLKRKGIISSAQVGFGRM